MLKRKTAGMPLAALAAIVILALAAACGRASSPRRPPRPRLMASENEAHFRAAASVLRATCCFGWGVYAGGRYAGAAGDYAGLG